MTRTGPPRRAEMFGADREGRGGVFTGGRSGRCGGRRDGPSVTAAGDVDSDVVAVTLTVMVTCGRADGLDEVIIRQGDSLRSKDET